MFAIFLSIESTFWGTAVILFIIGLAYLSNRLTKGLAIGYINYKMRAKRKKALVITHGLSSLVLAMSLSNNYLNEIEFFKRLFEENQFWIAGSILILLFFFIILFGAALTTIVTMSGLERSDKKESLISILNL
jgi:hypothetical protein